MTELSVLFFWPAVSPVIFFEFDPFPPEDSSLDGPISESGISTLFSLETNSFTGPEASRMKENNLTNQPPLVSLSPGPGSPTCHDSRLFVPLHQMLRYYKGHPREKKVRCSPGSSSLLRCHSRSCPGPDRIHPGTGPFRNGPHPCIFPAGARITCRLWCHS